MKALALAMLWIATPVLGNDGLVVHFTITKTMGSATNTYSNGVLMRLTESTTQIFPGQYEMRLESRQIADETVSLMVTLKDLSDGKPRYAGSNAVELKVGQAANLVLHELPTTHAHYEILLDTSYGELP